MYEPEASDAGCAFERQAVPTPLGAVEPHAALLRQPPEGQLLYKVMRAEYLIDSIAGSYLSIASTAIATLVGLTFRMAHSFLPTGPATRASDFKRRRSSRLWTTTISAAPAPTPAA